jgi:hypothetical protein
MKNLFITTSLLSLSLSSFAEDKEIQDMSDPLAVYTQAGAGYTDKGLNIKLGQAYDTGSDTTMAMRVLEVKGFYGETLGFDDSINTDDSVDAIRFRNFELNLKNGRGAQIDINYNFDPSHLANKHGDISYSLMQALPKLGRFSFYPLAGAGLAFGNNAIEDDNLIDSGFSIYGAYALVGMYGKVDITDNIWLNYNPFYLSTLSGSDRYKNNAFGENNDTVLLHEFAVNYQINPRMNIRYFANWSEYNNFNDGSHRIEINYQL